MQLLERDFREFLGSAVSLLCSLRAGWDPTSDSDGLNEEASGRSESWKGNFDSPPCSHFRATKGPGILLRPVTQRHLSPTPSRISTLAWAAS